MGYPIDPSSLSISDEDIQGLMEVVHGLQGSNGLDLILHSSGGYAEATEAFVSYLRTKFQDIRVIIPYAAMSAATMLSCSANKIIMGKHSFIGPIDPQLVLQTQVGPQSVAAQAIIDQFDRAKNECQDPKNLNVWYPILGQYGPVLKQQCENLIALSRTLVSDWLQRYMFVEKDNKKTTSENIASYLTNHTYFKTHNRHINRDEAKSIGLLIDDLAGDQTFQGLVLSVFHATTHTFTGAGTIKIIENHLGRAYLKQPQIVQFTQPPSQPQAVPSQSGATDQEVPTSQ